MPGVVYRDLNGLAPVIELAIPWRNAGTRQVIDRLVELANYTGCRL